MSSEPGSRGASEILLDSDAAPARVQKRKAAEIDEKSLLSKRAAKKKRKNKTSSKEGDDDGLYVEVGVGQQINPAIGQMDNHLSADHIGRQIKRFEPDLSSLEIEERRIPESAIIDTTSWSRARNLENLAAYVEYFSGKSKAKLSTAAPGSKGCPHTIVVAAAGLRAADLTRSLRVFQSESAAVAKLFAKHIKLKDAINSTKNTRMNIGVGTPQRLLDLIEQGALTLDLVERILIDASQVNTKKRGILDMAETEVPLTRLLALKELKARYGADASKPVKILLY